jgi:molybdenum cofactor biosynthesis enzyme MoaA
MITIDLFKPIITSVARHALTSFAGALVTNGYLQSSQAQQLIGGGLALVSVVLAALSKYNAAKTTQAAYAAPSTQAKIATFARLPYHPPGGAQGKT